MLSAELVASLEYDYADALDRLRVDESADIEPSSAETVRGVGIGFGVGRQGIMRDKVRMNRTEEKEEGIRLDSPGSDEACHGHEDVGSVIVNSPEDTLSYASLEASTPELGFTSASASTSASVSASASASSSTTCSEYEYDTDSCDEDDTTQRRSLAFTTSLAFGIPWPSSHNPDPVHDFEHGLDDGMASEESSFDRNDLVDDNEVHPTTANTIVTKRTATYSFSPSSSSPTSSTAIHNTLPYPCEDEVRDGAQDSEPCFINKSINIDTNMPVPEPAPVASRRRVESSGSEYSEDDEAVDGAERSSGQGANTNSTSHSNGAANGSARGYGYTSRAGYSNGHNYVFSRNGNGMGNGGDDSEDESKRPRRQPAGPPSPPSTPSSSSSSNADSEEEEEDNGIVDHTSKGLSKHTRQVSVDDDVPLARQIPGALRAQRTIRRQVRDEIDQRRAAKAVSAAVAANSAPIGSVGVQRRTTSTISPSASGEHHGQQTAVTGRPRTRTLPSQPRPVPSSGSGNPAPGPLPVQDLTRKLMGLHTTTTSGAAQPGSNSNGTGSVGVNSRPRRPSLDLGGRSVPMSNGAGGGVPQENPGSAKTLRPMRSFHKPTAQALSNTAEPVRVPPMPVPPNNSGAAGANLLRNPTTSSRSRRPSQDSRAPTPLSGAPRSSDDKPRSTQQQPATRPPSADREQRSRRPSLERPRVSLDHGSSRPPTSTPAPPQAPQPPAQSQGMKARETLWQQRVFIGTMQRFCLVEIGSNTSAGEVLRIVESQGALEAGGIGGWMLWELSQDFGMGTYFLFFLF